MPDQHSAELSLMVSREQAENAFRKGLAIYVGGKNRFSVERLCKGIGLYRADGKLNTKAIYDFLSYPSGHPDHRPLNLGIVFSITRFLGAEFTNEWLQLADQVARDLPGDEPDPGELAADISEDTAKIVRMAADRDLTNDDPNQLRETGTRMMTRGAQLVSISGRTRRRA